MAKQEKPAKKRPNLKGLLGLGRTVRGKLLFWLLTISLAAIAVIALFSYRSASVALQRQSFESLESTLVFGRLALEQYFSEQEKILGSVANTMNVLHEDAYQKLAAIREIQKERIGGYFDARFSDVQGFSGNPQQVGMFAGLAKDVSAELDSEFASWLEAWLDQHDFFSLLLLSSEGKVLYSSDSGVQRGAAVPEDSTEWRALQKGLLDSALTDYGPSAFQADKMVCYFSTPFTHEGQTGGTFLFRLKDNALDGIMKKSPGLGGHGEAYLIGPDGMFRSNSVFFEEPTLMNSAFTVDNELIAFALAGEEGEKMTVNYRGEHVLSSYSSVYLYGVTWALLVETDQGEAVTPASYFTGEKVEAGGLVRLAETYGFPDVYLVQPDGHIFYSVKRNPDYMTNILNGPFAGSGLSKAVAEAVEKKAAAASDYELYAPIGGKPAAFMAVPIVDRGQLAMIAAIQMPIDRINATMNARAEFEKKATHKLEMPLAETYLIGQDKLWRSEAANPKAYGVESTLLNPKAKVETKAVQEALAGKDSTEVIVNSLGEKVLSSWAPFNYKNLNWAVISEVSEQEVHKPVRSLMYLIGGIALAAAAVIATVTLLIAGGITRQVDAIMNAMAKVEKGDYSGRAAVTSTDELGKMAGDFNTMTATIDNLITTREKEHDKLSQSIIQLLEEITLLSEGDLSIRATVTDDVIGTLADSLNLMLEQLGTAFRRIKDSADQVSSTANLLSSSTQELADQNSTQSALVNEAMERISRLTEEIRKAADQAETSASTSRVSSHAAEDGAGAVRETSQAMEAIRGNVQNTARAIKRLGESSQEISDFARSINEISDRTSILALNASIQAAAAGEEGRGFAVVAEEIQRLAERAAVSTRQIETLIRNILSEITEAGISMDASIQEVVQGTKLSQNALTKLEEITARSNEVAELIQGLAAVSKEQAETTAELAGKMKDIGTISLETAQETMGASVSMREMAFMGRDMLQAVEAFKLEKTDEKAPDADPLGRMLEG
jgi:methyl-accepting chemotaxis protein